MENEYFLFNPGTNTCKAPPVTNFEHLLGFVSKLEQYLTVHNQEDILNVNNLLEQTLNLQVSNIIQRVIAQILGAYGTGFITINGTEDGNLCVAVKEQLVAPAMMKSVAISENTAASNEIIGAVAGKKICITNLVFTVAGEINITLQSAANALTGAMDFGAANEPRGFVSNHGNFPLKTVEGEAFNILMSAAVQLSGYCTYFLE